MSVLQANCTEELLSPAFPTGWDRSGAQHWCSWHGCANAGLSQEGTQRQELWWLIKNRKAAAPRWRPSLERETEEKLAFLNSQAAKEGVRKSRRAQEEGMAQGGRRMATVGR